MEENRPVVAVGISEQVGQQQSPAHPSSLQKFRSLIAFVDDQEKRNTLLGRQPRPGEDLTLIEQDIARYNAARVSRAKFTHLNPVVDESDPILDQIRSRPDIISVFSQQGLPWRTVMIDLKQVLSFQPIVRVDDLDERIAVAVQESNALVELLFPQNIKMEAYYEASEQGHTIIVSNPNLTFIPAQLPVTVWGQTMPAPAFIPQFTIGFFNVVHYQGRYFIRDGYHRAAGLLRKNTDPQLIVPAILVEAQTLNQTGWRPGMIAEAILLSDHPPFVSDFWDDTVAYDLLRQAKRRVFRMHLDFFEIAVS